MDFQTAMNVAAMLSFALLFISLVQFGRVFNGIRGGLSSSASRALVCFAAACLMLGLQILGSVFFVQLSGLWIGFFFMFLVTSQVQVIIADDKLRQWFTALTVLFGLTLSYVTFTNPEPYSTLRTAMLMVFLVISLCSTFTFVRKSVSAFSVSSVVLLISFSVSWYSQTYGVVAQTQYEYFPLVFIPSLMASAILASIQKPWRLIISLFFGLFALMTGASIIAAALISNTVQDFIIYAYVTVATFAACCILVPLGYFVDQAVVTRARTPFFMSLTIISISLLAATHANAWSIAVMRGNWGLEGAPTDWLSSLTTALVAYESWDPTLLFIDWTIGLSAVFTFSLAALSSTFSERAISFTIDALLFLVSALLVLGNPLVHAGRWELLPLYVPVLVVLLLGIFAFVGVARDMGKSGSGKAAARYLRFVFAALGIGIVAMFSDRLTFGVVPVLLVGAGLLLLGSTPSGVSPLRMRRRTSEPPVQEV